ncbi:MAG TPA: PQQ-binding-like beta-propeller repeat protein [Vicinamibacterales bacterium]|jgi:outer membrane protein assembly factor BamB|nr:PQQ-binding-like beta-propeller repeat protein [Vicinamibacterales bacterium]
MAREQRARVNRPPSLLIVTGITLGALAVSLFAQSALDYPQWRGQVRDGSASGFVEPSSWPQALKQQWKVDVGEGYATPVVIGDIVYVFTRRDGQEVMAALDTASGKERWRSGYAAAYAPSPPTKVHGSGPKATPLYLDGKLFTQGITGIVSALDATSGKRLWQTREPAEHPFYSAASSPAGERGLMLVHPGNYEALTAYDVNDGTVKWITGDGGFFMSPLIVTIEGTRQAVTVTQSAVIGVSLPDGRLLWRYPWSGGGMGGSMPVAYGQTIVVSAGVGVTALKPTHRGSTWVAEMAWETKDVSTYVSNSVVIGDTLFGFSTRNSGQFFAIDARDGKVLWLGPPREAANSAVVKANNVIFFLNDDGELIVARSSRERFDIIARYTVSETATWAQPAISGNRIFIKDAGSIALWTID